MNKLELDILTATFDRLSPIIITVDMIATLETALGRQAVKIMRPMQPGDVTATFADVSALKALTGYDPKVPLEDGIPQFIDWYRHFYG